MTESDFYATLPNDYYRAAPRRHVETTRPEEFAAVEREVKERFHPYNGHWRRILNRARAQTAQYVRSPHVLYTDFRKYLSRR